MEGGAGRREEGGGWREEGPEEAAAAAFAPVAHPAAPATNSHQLLIWLLLSPAISSHLLVSSPLLEGRGEEEEEWESRFPTLQPTTTV